MTLSTPFLHRTEMFANLIKRYGTHRSSTRYLQGVSHFKKPSLKTLHFCRLNRFKTVANLMKSTRVAVRHDNDTV